MELTNLRIVEFHWINCNSQIRKFVDSSIQGAFVERAPKENRFEFVVLAGKRARQLLAGAVPRETGNKKIAIAQKEILRRKVVKIEEE
jgi:DNA-directed RNA polymerase subunit K/omega